MPTLPKMKPILPLYREIVRDLVEHIRLLKGGTESRQIKHYVADVYWRSHRFQQADTLYRQLLRTYPKHRDNQQRAAAKRTIAFAILKQRFAAAVSLASSYLLRMDVEPDHRFRRHVLTFKSLADRLLRNCARKSVKVRRTNPGK